MIMLPIIGEIILVALLIILKKKKYENLLKKSIESLTGTNDLPIDWLMEKAMRNPEPLINESLSEYERTINIDDGTIEIINDGKLWTDQFGVVWNGTVALF